VKWGLQFANQGPFAQPELAATLAESAEEAGFESVWAVEHVVFPRGHSSRYEFTRDGKLPEGGDRGQEADLPDPLIWLSYIAARTTRIRLATGILILPQRNPLITAKELATLDVLSGGRVSIGVGIGWLEEEFEALGVPWARRGDRTEEYIKAMRALWREGDASFTGDFTSFTRVIMQPKPVQPAGVPLIIGGHRAPAARRAGRVGDGFFPAIYPPQETLVRLPKLIEIMRESAREAGRNPDAIEITSGGARRAHDIGPWVDLGVDRMVIRARSTEPFALREELLRFGDEVIARC
jgi:probable F420-dependent oxidoreductase